jgi:DNA-binding CsgD family transcriptional regulator
MSDAVNPRMRTNLHRRLHHKPLLRDDDFFSPGDPARAELQERLAALHLGRFMSVGLPFSDRERLVLVLHRDLCDGRDFDADQQSFALQLLPHLHQSMQSYTRFEAQRQRVRSLEGAMDQLRCALVLSTRDARVGWANRAARQILERGTHLWIEGERLRARSTAETAQLRRMIDRAGAALEPTSSERFCILGKTGDQPLQVMMQAVDGEGGPLPDRSTGAQVLLILSEPNQRAVLPAEFIGKLFGVSPAESCLVAALCSGSTVEEYAGSRGVTIGTARYQLKQVLMKTQAHRQSDLIRRVYGSVLAQAAWNAQCPLGYVT